MLLETEGFSSALLLRIPAVFMKTFLTQNFISTFRICSLKNTDPKAQNAFRIRVVLFIRTDR